MAEILYGAPVADALDARTAERVAELERAGIEPTLAIVRVGEDPSQVSYERGAVKRCDRVGIGVRHEVLAADASQEEALACIERLNGDSRVHGILLLQPLPKSLDADAVRNAIAPEKDVDAVGDETLARVLLGDASAFAPCTPQACLEILDHYGVDVAGKRACVIGRSLVVGKPLAMLLLARDATVAICHSRTADLPAVAREADLLVAAVGRERMVGAECTRPGQVVLDVGINWNEAEGRLYGDVDFDAVEPVVDALTPVPRGVGSVTTSVLVSHVAQAASRLGKTAV